MGPTVAAAGTHPLTVREESEVSGAAGYRALNDSMRALARREPTIALHVHVVPAPEDAVRLLNGLRRSAPVLLALSANSPFWQGRDSGFASARTVIFRVPPGRGCYGSSRAIPIMWRSSRTASWLQATGWTRG